MAVRSLFSDAGLAETTQSKVLSNSRVRSVFNNGEFDTKFTPKKISETPITVPKKSTIIDKTISNVSGFMDLQKKALPAMKENVKEKVKEIAKGLKFQFTTPSQIQFDPDAQVKLETPEKPVIPTVSKTPEVGKKLTVADFPQTTLSQAPKQTVWQKVSDFLRNNLSGDTDKNRVAMSQNAYAVNKVTNGKYSLTDLAKPGGNIMKNSVMEDVSKELGIRSFPTNSEITNTLLTLSIGAGLATAPLKILKSIGIYTAVDAVKTKIINILSDGKANDLSELAQIENPTVKNAVDIVEFISLGYITHGINKKAPEVFNALTKDVIKKYNLPQTVVLPAQDLRSLNNKTTNDILKTLKLTPEELKTARTKAVGDGNVVIETQDLVKLVDKPYWKKIKGMFKLSPTDQAIVGKNERSIRSIAGLLSDGEQKPQTIINEVFKNGMENTPEGKAVIKTAMEAKNAGLNIVVTKTGAEITKQTPKGSAEITTTTKEPVISKKLETVIVPVKTEIKTPETFKSPVEEKAFAKLSKDPVKVVEEYRDAFGNEVSPDLALTLFEDYKGFNSAELSRATGAVKSIVYENLLETEKGARNNTVLLTAGGAGSGKTTTISKMSVDESIKDKYSIIVDTTLSANSALGDIKKAIDGGYNVNIAYVLRDPLEAWSQGVLKRVGEEGRVVSEGYFLDSHINAQKNIIKAYDKYNGNNKIDFAFYNNLPDNNFNYTDIDTIKKYLYNKEQLAKEISDATEKAYETKQITKQQYEALTQDREGLERGSERKLQKESQDQISGKEKPTGEVTSKKTNLPTRTDQGTDKKSVSKTDGREVGEKKTKTISKEERKEIQSLVKETINADSQEEAVSRLKDFVETNVIKTSDERQLKVLKVIRAEMNRQMYMLAGADTGNYKKDFAYLQMLKNDESIGEIINSLEDSILMIDDILKNKTNIPSGFADVGGYSKINNYGNSLIKRAIKEYGTTSVPESIGFITPDGKAIDSSGRKQGSQSEGRNVDHRQISIDALPEDSPINNASEALIEFMNQTGSIRIVSAGKQGLNIDVVKYPTGEQLALLKKLAKNQDEIYADISTDNGGVLKSGKFSNFEDYKKFLDENFEKDFRYPRKVYDAINEVWGSNLSKEEVDILDFNELRNNASMGLEGGIDEFDKLVKKAPSGFADVGGYSDTVSAKKFFSEMKPIEMPELVAMTKEMLGSVPTLKKFKDALGKFYYSGKIKLTPEIFKDPELVTRVLAHEMGHMVDWFDQKSLSRRGSNILGRIASVNKYLKHFLKEYPESTEELITPKDRIRFRKEAKRIAKEEGVEITKEVVVGTAKIKPEEVLAIWNSTVSAFDKDPELLKYISGLTTYQKKSIVIQAMKGTIPKWVKYERQVKETITEKVFKNAPADIKALYEKLLKEEVIKRKLFELKTITDELKYVSMKWKPFNPAEDVGFTKYRFSSVELYADAVSVMFNDPALLQELAPNFHKAFFNYLDNKPEAKKVLFSTWDLLNQGEEAVINKRLADIGNMFDEGEKGWVAKYNEKKRIESSLLYKLQVLFDDKNTPINRKVQQALKEGKIIPDNLNPTFIMHGLNYGEGKLKNYISDGFEPIYKLTKEIDQTLTLGDKEMDGWEMLGTTLLLERAGNERGELANPKGYNPKTAPQTLEGLYKKLTPENEARLKKALQMFRETIQKSLDLAEKNRFYNPDLLVEMKANKTYATFQVLDYIDTYISSHVYHQVGTLKDVANPATASLMKLISLHQNIERNNSKIAVKDFLETNFTKEIQNADARWDGKKLAVVDPKDPKMGLVTFVVDGKVNGVYVDKDIANTLNYIDNSTINMLSKVSRLFSVSGVYRPLFTTINLGFQSFNFVRDFTRFWKNMPNTTLPKAVVRYIQATPSAIKRGFNIDDKLIREMQNEKILGLTFNDMFKDGIDSEQKQIERVLQSVGVLNQDHKKMRKILTPFVKMLEIVESVGNAIETIPKVAGYLELKGKLERQELAEFIRTSVGSPDFRIGGTATPVSNNLFLFSNAIKEGIKSDMKIAFTKNRSRSSWWFKTMLATFLPKILMFAIGAGYLGEKYKDIMDKQSEYDKANYNLVPLGLDENNKGIALRVPQDETGRLFGSIFWKLINLESSKENITKTLGEIFSFGAGQFPNLSPSFTGIDATIQYLSGKNPYDSFRSRYVIPDTEFKAGVEKSAPIFIDWLVKNQGAGIILPSKHYGDVSPTSLERLIEAPILANVLGRWIKVTDYGDTEKLKDIGKKVETEKAQKTLDTREAIDKAIKDHKNGKSKIQVENELVKDVLSGMKKDSEYKQNKTELLKKFNISRIRGKNDPSMNSLIDARTNDEKAMLLIEINNNISSDEFNTLLKEAKTNKIISNDVVKKYNKLKK